MNTHHEPFFIKNNHADSILFYIHGILGSPFEFRRIIEWLKVDSVDYKAILLPGHGDSGSSFSGSSESHWRNHVENELAILKNSYSKIFLIGHSLGGLLALNVSVKTHVDGIVLLNTPIKTRMSIRQIGMSMRVLFSSKTKFDPMLDTYRKTFSVGLNDWWTLPFWLNRLLDVNRIARRTISILHKIDTPVLIYQSRHDETVHPVSAEILKHHLGGNLISLKYLNHSTHAYFVDEEFNEIIKGIVKLIHTS